MIIYCKLPKSNRLLSIFQSIPRMSLLLLLKKKEIPKSPSKSFKKPAPPPEPLPISVVPRVIKKAISFSPTSQLSVKSCDQISEIITESLSISLKYISEKEIKIDNKEENISIIENYLNQGEISSFLQSILAISKQNLEKNCILPIFLYLPQIVDTIEGTKILDTILSSKKYNLEVKEFFSFIKQVTNLLIALNGKDIISNFNKLLYDIFTSDKVAPDTVSIIANQKYANVHALNIINKTNKSNSGIFYKFIKIFIEMSKDIQNYKQYTDKGETMISAHMHFVCIIDILLVNPFLYFELFDSDNTNHKEILQHFKACFIFSNLT